MGLNAASIYKKLYSHFGKQYWWPAESAFEVIIGAILTQNTAWVNVEKAIKQLKKNKLLDPARLRKATHKKIASAIVPSGYYNVKTKRLKEFLKFFFENYQASLKKMSGIDYKRMRLELLSVKGIGPETADSILLYALRKPVFVVDAYTRRILTRHKLIEGQSSYDEIQKYFIDNLQGNVKLFNEYHALLVKLGKVYCLKNKPKCRICPLQ